MNAKQQQELDYEKNKIERRGYMISVCEIEEDEGYVFATIEYGFENASEINRRAKIITIGPRGGTKEVEVSWT